MVKGVARRVIVVESPDPRIFEQAIFIVRSDAAQTADEPPQQVVDQAVAIAREYARSHPAAAKRPKGFSPWAAALVSVAAAALLWLIVWLM